MPATNSGITPELVYALKRGEDSALEHVFHASYDTLRQQACAVLDAAGATRVIERVFLALWKARVQFETPDEVDRFLASALREGIAREQGRMAAVHRFERSEHVHLTNGRSHTILSPDEQWTRINSAIHAPPPDAARTAHLMADQSRHLAATHVEAIGAKSNWKRTAILAGLAVTITGGLIWALDRASAPVKLEKAFASPDVRTLTTRYGQRGTIDLRDGGAALLGPRSSLKIPPGYGEDLRVVRIEGAAQLRTANSAAAPIEARLAGAPISVLGSSFTVSAYPGDAEYFVAANDAHAEVFAGRTPVTVNRGQVLAIQPTGLVRVPTDAEAEEVLGWTREEFVVNDRPLRDALSALRLAYGIEILVPDLGLLDRHVQVRAPLNSSRDAIAGIEASGGLRFGYEHEQMVLRDANAAPAPSR